MKHETQDSAAESPLSEPVTSSTPSKPLKATLGPIARPIARVLAKLWPIPLLFAIGWLAGSTPHPITGDPRSRLLRWLDALIIGGDEDYELPKLSDRPVIYPLARAFEQAGASAREARRQMDHSTADGSPIGPGTYTWRQLQSDFEAFDAQIPGLVRQAEQLVAVVPNVTFTVQSTVDCAQAWLEEANATDASVTPRDRETVVQHIVWARENAAELGDWAYSLAREDMRLRSLSMVPGSPSISGQQNERDRVWWSLTHAETALMSLADTAWRLKWSLTRMRPWPPDSARWASTLEKEVRHWEAAAQKLGAWEAAARDPTRQREPASPMAVLERVSLKTGAGLLGTLLVVAAVALRAAQIPVAG